MRVNLPDLVSISNLRDGALSLDGEYGPGEVDVPDLVGDLLIRQDLAASVPEVPEVPEAHHVIATLVVAEKE